MKKQLTMTVLLGLCFLSFTGSEPDSKVFTTPDLVWAGIDFSEAKLIGPEGFSDPYDIRNRFFISWNNLIIAESDKYNIEKFYRKDQVINDLSVVSRRNEMPDADSLVINESYSFEEGKLESIIKSYDLEKSQKGVGLVYVVESFNKTGIIASVNVVFFDISTKDILWTRRYQEKPVGFGLRNYWAGAIYKVMKSNKSDYEKAMKKVK